MTHGHKNLKLTCSVPSLCVRITTVAMKKQYKYNECVAVALVILHEKLMRCVVVWGAVRLYNIFTHYLLIGKIFGEKKLLNARCVF